MIHNLIAYLRAELPTIKFYPDEYKIHFPDNQVPDSYVLVKESGGSTTPWYALIKQNYHIYGKDIDTAKARELAYAVYDKINNRFGIQLPSVTVDGVNFGEVIILQINSSSIPQSLGEDKNGRSVFITSYQFIYRSGGLI